MTLLNPTGGAVVGASTTTVDLVGTSFTVAPPFDPMLGIGRQWGANRLTWIGDGPLQRADRLEGPWQSVAGAQSPFTVQSQIPATFYRLMRPRPVNVYVPSSYDGHTPIPLVILLHGYGQSGEAAADWLRLSSVAESLGVLWCAPGSRTDKGGNQFWNATDACCDFDGSGEDDASYLRDLIREIAAHSAVDRKRVYLIGLSNGAFMAYQMALLHADLVAGVAAIAGMTSFERPDGPSQPVNILHIHGTADTTVAYGGGALNTPDFPANMASFPGAQASVRLWALYNGCSGPVTESQPSLDIDLDVPGRETAVTRYANHPPGGAVELWAAGGASHSPTLAPDFSRRVLDWLLAHPKP